MRIRSIIRRAAGVVALLASQGCTPGASPAGVTGLRCEDFVNPMGIDEPRPALSWRLESDRRGERQTARQILVASSEALLRQDRGDLWDSGRVLSDQSQHVIYQGALIPPRTTVYWKVRVGDRDGRPSAWSEPATWTTGVRGDWTAGWIAARDVPMKPPVGQSYIRAKDQPGNFEGAASVRHEAVMMRREVALDAVPVRALARVTALGFVDVYINGEKPDARRVVAPALSDLTRRVYYDTYDVTSLLKPGVNTLGLVLGNGFFSTPGRGWARWYGVGNEPVASLEVDLTMPDGSRKRIVTDEAWTWATGEIVFNDYFVGETQDLRLARPGWNRPGFKAEGWTPVVTVAPPPGRLEPNPGPPVRMTEIARPVRVEGNRYYFDRMFTGWPVVEVQGQPGQEVRFGDHGKPRGQGAAWNPGGNSADFKFTLRGGGVETLEPRFMVHSIGPVLSIDGIDPPPASAVAIKAAHADLRVTGEFSCSNPFLNRVFAATLRTHMNYKLDIPMDPTREKAGWTQDVQNMFSTAAYLTDMTTMYRRWWTDMLDAQLPDGSAGSVAPMIWGGQENCWNDPWWGGMIVFLPFKHYQYYGDIRMLERAYEPMKAYLGWLTAKADPKDGLLHWSGASDWIEVGIEGWGPPKRTPRHLVSTCAWYLYADMVRQTAEILGKPDEAATHARLARQIKDAFIAGCFDPETGLYAGATDSQTSLILPLFHGLVPEGREPLVMERLLENIAKWNGHLNSGFVGTPHLLEGLPNLGLAEVSYTMVTQQDYPGWNTLIADGVMKETWRGGLVQMPSLGGSIGQWFFKAAGGIRPDPAGPGFKKIDIRPSLMGDLTWVNCAYDSPYGRIVSNWTRADGAVTMEVVIPPNTTATVHVPSAAAAEVRESDRPAAQAGGVTFLRMDAGAAVFAVESGRYRFQARLP